MAAAGCCNNRTDREGSIASPKNPKTRRDYPKLGPPNVTPESFRKRFSEFLAAYDLDAKVKARQMAAFLEIAQEHLRDKAAWEATKKAIQLRDHRDCEIVIKGIRRRLKEFGDYLDQASQKQGVLTESLARSSRKKIESTPTWEELLSGQEQIIRSQKALLSMIKDSLKNAERELTIDLLNFITEEFPHCAEKERNALIGATFAGVGLYDEKTLADEAGPVGPIPMKVSRAKKRIEKLYSVPGSERNNPAVIGRRKKERLLRQKNGKGPVV